jgi:hypothetical protein
MRRLRRDPSRSLCHSHMYPTSDVEQEAQSCEAAPQRAAPHQQGFSSLLVLALPSNGGPLSSCQRHCFKASRSVLLRGQHLSPDLFEIAVALKNGSPATREELAARLHKTAPMWSAATAQSILDSLKALPMSDGTVRRLVAKGYNEQGQVSGL